MTDEEKKVIESFKENNNNDLSRFDDFNSYTQFKVKRDKIIIDLIEKQSKEIEKLKMITKEYDSFLGNEKIIIADKSYFVKGYFKEKFISKDKIKAKIEELKDGTYDAKIVLQSLLEKE